MHTHTITTCNTGEMYTSEAVHALCHAIGIIGPYSSSGPILFLGYFKDLLYKCTIEDSEAGEQESHAPTIMSLQMSGLPLLIDAILHRFCGICLAWSCGNSRHLGGTWMEIQEWTVLEGYTVVLLHTGLVEGRGFVYWPIFRHVVLQEVQLYGSTSLMTCTFGQSTSSISLDPQVGK